MRVLAIESATPATGVALGVGRELVAGSERVDPTGHASFLMPAIDFCFARAGWSPSDIDAVVVDVGPGLYTGIRVGIAAAQGIASTLGIPLVPATALDALALEAATGHRHIWALVDVRRGEVAACSYRPVPGGVIKDGGAHLLTPERLRALLESEPEQVLVVGDTGALSEGVLAGLHRVKVGRPRYPTARALLQILAGRLERDDLPGPEEVRPLYLREPDVNLNFEKIRPRSPWPETS